MVTKALDPLGYDDRAQASLITKVNRDPTTADTGYNIGSVWINQNTGRCFRLTQKLGLVATWVLTGEVISDQIDILYVGKHGNNSNDGKSLKDAFLTFGAALTASSAGDVIVCEDAGVYVENITMLSDRIIWAPNATLDGTITAVDDSSVKLYKQIVGVGEVGVSKTTGTSYFNFEAEEVECISNGSGVTATVPSIYYAVKRVFIVNGICVANTSNHIHLHIGDIYINGLGIGIATLPGGLLVGEIDHIIETGGTPIGGIFCAGGEMNLEINTINVPSGSGILCSAGNARITSKNITGAVAYNVAGGTLDLITSQLTGTETYTSGTRRIISPENGIDNVTIGLQIPSRGIFSALDGNVINVPGGWVSGLIMNYSSPLFRLLSPGLTGLSASNPAYITMPPASDPTDIVTVPITSIPQFNDASGVSNIAGNRFGLFTGIAYTEDVPFYLYAVMNDNDADIEFMISRCPGLKISPITTEIGTPSNPIADEHYSFWAFSDVTVSQYDTNPCLMIGSFRMRMDASDDWTVQSLNTSDGIGKFQEDVIFSVPTGTFGAASGKYCWDNGGTAPNFTNQLVSYKIDPYSIECELSQALENLSVAGVGAVQFRIASPFVTDPTSPTVFETKVVNYTDAAGNWQTALHFIFTAITTPAAGMRITGTGSDVTNAFWGTAGMDILAYNKFPIRQS